MNSLSTSSISTVSVEQPSCLQVHEVSGALVIYRQNTECDDTDTTKIQTRELLEQLLIVQCVNY